MNYYDIINGRKLTDSTTTPNFRFCSFENYKAYLQDIKIVEFVGEKTPFNTIKEFQKKNSRLLWSLIKYSHKKKKSSIKEDEKIEIYKKTIEILGYKNFTPHYIDENLRINKGICLIDD